MKEDTTVRLIDVVDKPLMNLYSAVFSQAKDVDQLEEVINSNPTQSPSKGKVLDFTIESTTPPYTSLSELRTLRPEVDTYILHPRSGPGHVLIRCENGEFKVGRK
jgi:hypothetical protein